MFVRLYEYSMFLDVQLAVIVTYKRISIVVVLVTYVTGPGKTGLIYM